MTKKEKITAGETAPLFEDGVNLEIPSLDRPIKYIQEDGKVLYLNKKQNKFLNADKDKEKQMHSRMNRCLVSSKTHGVVRCTKDCSNCRWFNDKHRNAGMVSLDSLYDMYSYELEDTASSIVETLEHEEIVNRVHAAINNLNDEKDKTIINYILEGLDETSIARILGISQRAVAKRRIKTFSQLAEALKDLL